MLRAWEIAKKSAIIFNGKAREFFAQALKMAWAEAKNQINIDDLVEEFWSNHKNIKRKTKPAQTIIAQVEQLRFCQKNLSSLSSEQLDSAFGKFSDFVKSWISGTLVKNSFGKHLYVKLS